jgi:hypothetical protein
MKFGIKKSQEMISYSLIWIIAETCPWNMETYFYNSCVTYMWTRAHATYKCNMCNKPLKHVEQLRETFITCTLQQNNETIETWLWNKHFNYSNFYVSVHVRPTLLSNLCMVCMFSLENTLTTLRTLNGTMFMSIILPNCASKWWLTTRGP